ncbi:MAG: hypothetical protein ACRENE_33150 [Polyangiaceae bacterium]
MNSRRLLPTGLFLSALVLCGGCSSTSSSNGGALPDSGCSANAAPPGARVPSEHRATAATCSPSACGGASLDAAPACSTDLDCNPDSGVPSYTTARCLNGSCTLDTCFADRDCAANEVCLCASTYYGGNACHTNVCIPAQCHVDSDCGPGGYCVATIGYCGSPEGYYCTKPTDPCIDPSTDCSCKSSVNGLSAPAACSYDAAVRQFVCAQRSTCAG